MQIDLFIGFVGVCISVLTFFIGRMMQAKEGGLSDGMLKSDVEYIKRRTDEVLIEQKTISKDLTELSKKIVEVEASTRQAHKRIDEIVGGKKWMR